MEDFYKYFQNKYSIDLRNLNCETLLNNIFCIGGQEGNDFLDDFLTHFNVHVEWIDYKDHFPSDGFGFTLKKFKSEREKPLKIKHLIKAYETRKWEYFE